MHAGYITKDPLTWLFTVWGLDMVGPPKIALDSFKYLLVAIDKFTKLIKAKPVTSSTLELAVKFISGLIHRFGIPHNVITDNGSNFTADIFSDYWEGKWPIRNPRNQAQASFPIEEGGRKMGG